MKVEVFNPVCIREKKKKKYSAKIKINEILFPGELV